MLSRTASKGYPTRCTPVQTTGSVPDNKREEPKWIWNLIAAKSKFKFHVAVLGVLVAAKVAAHLAGVLQKSEFISTRVKIPEIAVSAAAMALLLGKSVYRLLKDTKDIAGLVLYFMNLYKESVSATSESNKDTVPRSYTGAPSGAGTPSD